MLAETIAAIKPLDEAAMEKCRTRLANLTKPLGSLGRLRADHRIRPLGVEALLRVGREVWIAQPLGQALPVAARMGIDPLHGLPECGVTAGLADALDQARVGGRRGLVYR